MFDKKKLNFWRLTIIFGGFTIITLLFLWILPHPQTAQIMDGTMGNMMKQQHTKNISIYDVLKTENENNSSMSQMHSHHQNQDPIIYHLNFFTTSIISLLLPLIIGGTIILAILWFK